MRVTVDIGRCAASGACVRVASDVFELPPGAKVKLLQSEATEEQRPALLLAAELCPTGAISLS
ncbi:MAG: 4Fe-4S single cluster domain of Ferredoxin [Acidimicrobiia bacterium]|nr:4Fe-4S single cluster domain of Ferredoxin [Acidimicrobiia bacterium]